MESIPEGYKKTKAGIIPIEWEVVKLKDIAILTPGQHLLKSDYNSNGIGVPYLTGPSDLEDEVETKYTTSMQNICKKNDILITIKGSGCGSLFIANQKYCLGRQLMAISPKTFTSKVLYYMLLQNISHINNLVSGLIPQLTKKDLSEIPIVNIPMPEQEKIAKILTTWDTAINKQKELIQVKKQLKKGLMQKLLSGEVRFDGFSDEWISQKLSSISKVKKGKQLNKIDLIENAKYPVINGGIEPSGYTDTYNTDENTITISEGGNSCGYVNYITTKFWSGGHCYTPLDVKANVYFIYQYLKLNELKIMQLRVGSGLPNIQKGDIENFKIKLPSLQEQQKIAQVLSTADKEIELLKNELESLKEQKKGLMQRLLSGEVRVKV